MGGDAQFGEECRTLDRSGIEPAEIELRDLAIWMVHELTGTRFIVDPASPSRAAPSRLGVAF